VLCVIFALLCRMEQRLAAVLSERDAEAVRASAAAAAAAAPGGVYDSCWLQLRASSAMSRADATEAAAAARDKELREAVSRTAALEAAAALESIAAERAQGVAASEQVCAWHGEFAASCWQVDRVAAVQLAALREATTQMLDRTRSEHSAAIEELVRQRGVAADAAAQRERE
jgi:hypothetical protein